MRGNADGWSGVALASGVTEYGPDSFQQIHAAWTMPKVELPAGVSCPFEEPPHVYAFSIWPGIDGWNHDNETGALLQAGSNVTLTCRSGTVETSYNNWFEFLPYNSVHILNLPLEPGDEMSVYVWATSSTRGHAHLVNRTKKKSVTLAFWAHPDTHLIGATAEWIVERPTFDQIHAFLPDYHRTAIREASGRTGSGVEVSPGGNFERLGIQTDLITMVDPEDDDAVLSTAKRSGKRTILFRAQGPARADD